jgi:hypothetical protein
MERLPLARRWWWSAVRDVVRWIDPPARGNDALREPAEETRNFSRKWSGAVINTATFRMIIPRNMLYVIDVIT